MKAAIPAPGLPCKDDPELFFPKSGSSLGGKAQIETARALCHGCRIRAECLAAWRALPANERDVGAVAGGVFFKVGTGEATRRHLARRSEEAVA